MKRFLLLFLAWALFSFAIIGLIATGIDFVNIDIDTVGKFWWEILVDGVILSLWWIIIQKQ